MIDRGIPCGVQRIGPEGPHHPDDLVPLPLAEGAPGCPLRLVPEPLSDRVTASENQADERLVHDDRCVRRPGRPLDIARIEVAPFENRPVQPREERHVDAGARNVPLDRLEAHRRRLEDDVPIRGRDARHVRTHRHAQDRRVLGEAREERALDLRDAPRPGERVGRARVVHGIGLRHGERTDDVVARVEAEVGPLVDALHQGRAHGEEPDQGGAPAPWRPS
jgi:hypothetical protein